MSKRLFNFISGRLFISSRISRKEEIILRNNNVIFQTLICFCSDKKSESQNHLKKLLDDASPLKEDFQNLWSSSPYPEGTIFKKLNFPENPEYTKATSTIMFPGQGSQFVGMCDNLMKYPVVNDMFDAASEILQYDLLKLCKEGPENKLNRTEYCQAALLVTSLGALEKLKDEKPWAINTCTATCGFSIGEFPALVFAGCLTFEKALKLVKIRSEAMELCCKTNSGGMMTVLFGPDSNLKQAISDSINHSISKGVENAHCSIASYLFPGCKVIAGHAIALNYIIENKSKYRIKKLSKLNVSGAFHTPLMTEAQEIFKVALEKTDIKNPIIRVYSNVDGKPYRNFADIKKKLSKQICAPVKWEQIMHMIYDKKPNELIPYTYECGPGKSLSIILGKINFEASHSCVGVSL